MLEMIVHIQHIQRGNAFRNTHDGFHTGVRSFVNRIRGKCRRYENDRHIGACFLYGFFYGIEYRYGIIKFLAAFSRCYTGHHIGSVVHHLLGMERPFFSGNTLYNHTAMFINDYAHDNSFFFSPV